MHLISIVVTVLAFEAPLVLGWKSLMKRLPNGDRVPDPCDPARIWEGVGHLKPGGYGPRNQFGIDFKTHSMTWSKELCMIDSDLDGRTNGQELGDPNCGWTASNNSGLMSDNITHPGICEPMDSPKCKEVNKWIEPCPEHSNFTCDAINQTGTRNMTVKFPPTPLPRNVTVHQCMIFDFPQNGDFHIIANEPALDNVNVVHHILVYGCKDGEQPEHPVDQPYECPLHFDPACQDLIAVWLLGSDGSCVNENAGFRIGQKGYKRGGIQIHWENPDLRGDLVDGSGMRFYYTEKSGRQDSGILTVGQEYMVIPPGESGHTEISSCTPDCTRRKFDQNIHITFAMNHMHYLGTRMKIEHMRDGKVLHTISEDRDFKPENPRLFTHAVPIVVKPSDEIRTTCVFDSKSRNQTARAGPGYFSEMCYGFLTFYPKQAIQKGHMRCTAWKNIPTCHFEFDKTIDGCDFRNVHNLSNPNTREVYDRVRNHCRPFGPCYKECRQVVNNLKPRPCFHGDIWEWSRDKVLTRKMNDSARIDWFQFYAGYDSCFLTETRPKPLVSGIDNAKNGILANTADFGALLVGIMISFFF